MLGVGALLLLAFVSLVVVVLLVLLQLTRLGFLVRTTIPDRPRQRMFLASVSFLLTFVGVRILVHRIASHEGIFQWVVVRGTHIHHLVWGILILLLVGYGWLADLGRSHTPISIFFGRLMAVSYGAGAALTLDEFALWLNLSPDAYWSRQGRLSIDAVILFGALLAVGAWGSPFFRGLELLAERGLLFGKGLRRWGSTIRLVRLLRPRKARRLPRHTSV
ncbi:MAG TPA: hypothetical protein VL498_08375 [Terracidiphilus sp.]|jgi:hypothetical protein|nr:hypothetical protein [Terracidiphilus sp.]